MQQNIQSPLINAETKVAFFSKMLLSFVAILFSANGFSSSLNNELLDDSMQCTPTLWYADHDGDGYGSMYTYISSCTQPAGYVANNTDCNDYNANINPGMAEIYYNGIDDNCNTSIDDGAMILTQVQSQFSGVTLPAIDSKILVDVVNEATGYRFEVINITTGSIQFVETVNPYFRLTEMPSYSYEQTYRISVMVRRFFVPGGVNVWLNYYGPPRMVSTPSLADALVLRECGTEINANGVLTAETIPGATQYRFMIKRHLNDNNPINFSQATPSFNINQFIPYTYGAIYYVAVSVKIGTAQFSAYGNYCPVGTISPDTFSIKQCGLYYGNFYSYVSTNPIPYATEYRFLVKNISTGSQQVFQSQTTQFYINQIQDLQLSTEYAISVSAKSSGVWSAYGPACSIYSPIVGIKVDTKAIVSADFRAIASPNPFNDFFTINIADGAEGGTTDIKIYDMVGKYLAGSATEARSLSSHQLGRNLPAGVYNVVITQGDVVKAVKVIKQ